MQMRVIILFSLILVITLSGCLGLEDQSPPNKYGEHEEILPESTEINGNYSFAEPAFYKDDYPEHESALQNSSGWILITRSTYTGENSSDLNVTYRIQVNNTQQRGLFHQYSSTVRIQRYTERGITFVKENLSFQNERLDNHSNRYERHYRPYQNTNINPVTTQGMMKYSKPVESNSPVPFSHYAMLNNTVVAVYKINQTNKQSILGNSTRTIERLTYTVYIDRKKRIRGYRIYMKRINGSTFEETMYLKPSKRFIPRPPWYREALNQTVG